MTTVHSSTEQAPRDRAGQLYHELDYYLRAVKVLQQAAHEQGERRCAEHVAEAVQHLREARAALLLARDEA
jgi:hypothetical protein